MSPLLRKNFHGANYEGKDEDINDNAVLVANIIAKLTGKFLESHPN